MVYFPSDIMCLIFEYDNTYRERFNHVLCELHAMFYKNISNNILKAIFSHYLRYENNYLFLNSKCRSNFTEYSLSKIAKRIMYYYCLDSDSAFSDTNHYVFLYSLNVHIPMKTYNIYAQSLIRLGNIKKMCENING